MQQQAQSYDISFPPSNYVPPPATTANQLTPDAADNLSSFVVDQTPEPAPTNSFYAQNNPGRLEAAPSPGPQPLRQPPPTREPYSYVAPAPVPAKYWDHAAETPPTSVSYAPPYSANMSALDINDRPPTAAKVQPVRPDFEMPATAGASGTVPEAAWFNTARTYVQGQPETGPDTKIPALDPNSFDPVSGLTERGIARQTQDGYLTDGLPPPRPVYGSSGIPSTSDITNTIQGWIGMAPQDRTHHEFHPGDQIFWADQLKNSEASMLELRFKNDRLRAEVDAVKDRTALRQKNSEARDRARRLWYQQDEQDQVAVVSETGAIHWMPISLKRHLQAVGVASPEELPVIDCDGKLQCTDIGDNKYRWSYSKPPPYWVVPPADDNQLQEEAKIQILDRPYTFGLAGSQQQRAEWKEEDDFEDVLNINLLSQPGQRQSEKPRTASVQI